MDVALGVGIGGTTVKIALIDRNGELVQKMYSRTDAATGFARVVDDIADLAEDMRSHLPAGLGVPRPGDGRTLFRAVNRS